MSVSYEHRTKAAAGEATRLLTVSNRGPVEFRQEGGRLIATPGQGGLSTALGVAASLRPTTWLSSPMSAADREIAEGKIAASGADGASHFVTSDPEAYDLFYGCFANQVLWFLQHGMAWPEDLSPERCREAWQEGYVAVNQAFADAIVAELAAADYAGVMLHDYHFYRTPYMVRQARPDAFLQHFIHIPWPQPEEWQRLDADIVREVCEGLLANDSLVFQTAVSALSFLETCALYLPDAEIDAAAGVARLGGRQTRVWANGISVDPEELAEASASSEFSRYRYLLRAEPGHKTIVRVDRMDPSKNVLAGFEAYALVLESHPELRGKVLFHAHLFPTRTEVPLYREYQDQVFATVEALNRRFGTSHWQPVRLLVEHNRVQALAAMSLYDVLLVNPVADGMNLVAKEGPMVNQHNGVLVLSTTAGAHAELSCGSLSIDPLDVEGTAAALYRGLTMPPAERAERAQRLRQRLRQHDLRAWLQVLLDDIEGHAAGVSARGAAKAKRAAEPAA